MNADQQSLVEVSRDNPLVFVRRSGIGEYTVQDKQSSTSPQPVTQQVIQTGNGNTTQAATPTPDAAPTPEEVPIQYADAPDACTTLKIKGLI